MGTAMKQLLVVLAVLASPNWAFAQRATCTTTGSANAKLCGGLTAFYKFEEATDYERGDSYGYLDWHEGDGANVATSIGGGKFGNAISFAGSTTSYLYLPDTVVWGGGSWTTAVWIKPTSTTTGAALFSNDETNNHGPSLTFNASGQLVFQHYQDDNTGVTVTSGVVSTGTWHLVVVRVQPNNTGTGVMDIGISLDGGAFSETATTRWLRTLYPCQTVVVGWNYNGLMDGLLLAGRTWDSVDVSLYYNSGAGIDFPF